MSEQASVRICYVPQTFPCGPQSSCRGPVGQTEAELVEYTGRLRDALPGVAVEAMDASHPLRLSRDAPVVRLLNTVGQAPCPIFAVNGEVVSMGPPALGELVDLVKARLSGGTSSRPIPLGSRRRTRDAAWDRRTRAWPPGRGRRASQVPLVTQHIFDLGVQGVRLPADCLEILRVSRTPSLRRQALAQQALDRFRSGLAVPGGARECLHEVTGAPWGKPES
jgi:hypothetical protein